jgi:hypothetical protein
LALVAIIPSFASPGAAEGDFVFGGDPSRVIDFARKSTKKNRSEIKGRSVTANPLLALIHDTSVDNLESIVTDAELLPCSSSDCYDLGGEGAAPAVFLEAVPRSASGLLISKKYLEGTENPDWSDRVILVFSSALLARKDYHAADSWAWGVFDKDYDYRPNRIGEFLEKLDARTRAPYISDQKIHYIYTNEVVFRNAVSLENLVEIWTHPSSRKKVLQKLKGSRRPPPAGGWESLVVSRTKFPKAN